MGNYVIAIDGPAGVGKSTLARKLASALGFRYVDTGAMYRAVAWWLLQQGIDLTDEVSVDRFLPKIRLEITGDNEKGTQIRIGGQDVGPWIRTEEVADAASTIGAFPQARAHLVALYRQEGNYGNVVMEGRDIGTVAFPGAHLKLFITASEEVRRQRRYTEQRQKEQTVDPDNIEQILRKRDRRDQERKHAPLKPSEDAVIIDTTDMNIEEVFTKALLLARQAICSLPEV